MLYWVAVEEFPSKKEQEEQNLLPKLILAPIAVEARDDKDAALKVAMGNDALKGANKDRLQALVRPF